MTTRLRQSVMSNTVRMAVLAPAAPLAAETNAVMWELIARDMDASNRGPLNAVAIIAIQAFGVHGEEAAFRTNRSIVAMEGSARRKHLAGPHRLASAVSGVGN